LGDGTSWDMTNAKWLDLDPPRGRGQRGRKRRFEGSMKADASAAELAEEVELRRNRALLTGCSWMLSVHMMVR